MTTTPPTSPPRPTLEQQPGKPDVLVRLRVQHELAESRGFPLADCFTADLADAIATITGLRESDARRLQLINQAKGERDEARARCAELERELANARLYEREAAQAIVELAEMIDPHFFEPDDDDGQVPNLLAECPRHPDSDFCGHNACREIGCLHMKVVDLAPAPLPDAPQTGEAGRG